MKFRLDENIGQRGIELLKTAGHDVMTVPRAFKVRMTKRYSTSSVAKTAP